MRRLLTVLGIALTVLGAFWVLQGSGLLAGTPMSGQRLWLVIGLVVGGVGIGLLNDFW
jgi:NO-binding membrane sensor protein with MHYT domain